MLNAIILILLLVYMSNKRKLNNSPILNTLVKKQCISFTAAASDFPQQNTDIWKPFNNLSSSTQLHKNHNLMKVNVSGTDVKNHLLKDPLLDWLTQFHNMTLYNRPITRCFKKTILKNKSINDKKAENEKKNTNLLFEKGNEFENKITHYLYDKYKHDMITINSTGKSGTTRKNFNKTKKAMKSGIPIIDQAVLFNDMNKTLGTADLLIRSDYLNHIVTRKVLTEEEEHFKAPNLNGNYHYRVIDIKWTSMTLCADGYNIRNDGRFPAYKGQLAIYNCAMGNIQGFIPQQAYILAKSWKIDKKGEQKEGYNCFDLLGTINYNSFDYQYIYKTICAIKWMKELKTTGINWNPSNPHREELYPNMSTNFDPKWYYVKKTLAQELDEITQIWYVNVHNRYIAHNKNIKSWKDPNCTSDALEIGGKNKANVIDAILNINRHPELKLAPKFINNNSNNWQIKTSVDFYVDFETYNGCFDSQDLDIFNSKTNSSIVFMIGVGYECNDKWEYKNFTSNTLTLSEETKLFDEFTNFIFEQTSLLSPNKKLTPKLFHWSQAEISNFSCVQKRNNYKWTQWNNNVKWVDMYPVFISEPIVVKGSFNFKLKSIGNAMYNLGLIDTRWDDSGPVDGLHAMFDAIKSYDNKDNELMKTIIKYNLIDCKIMWDIVEYLRNNHVK